MNPSRKRPAKEPVSEPEEAGPLSSTGWTKRLVVDQFEHLQKMTGLSPTLDAAPAEECALLETCCNEKQTGFLDADLDGQCVWMCPPAHNETIEAYLRHYHAQKEKYPDLKGILVLPVWKTTPWNHLVERFDKVKEIPPGSKIWNATRPLGHSRNKLFGLTWATAVYVDA